METRPQPNALPTPLGTTAGEGHPTHSKPRVARPATAELTRPASCHTQMKRVGGTKPSWERLNDLRRKNRRVQTSAATSRASGTRQGEQEPIRPVGSDAAMLQATGHVRLPDATLRAPPAPPCEDTPEPMSESELAKARPQHPVRNRVPPKPEVYVSSGWASGMEIGRTAVGGAEDIRIVERPRACTSTN